MKENECMTHFNPHDYPIIVAPWTHMPNDASFNLGDGVVVQNPIAQTADKHTPLVHFQREL